MNAVYARVFGAHRPARTTVQVAGLPGEEKGRHMRPALWKNASVRAAR